MSKLQELLDEKWPLNTSNPRIDGINDLLECRRIFTEGYNAALNIVHEKAEQNWLLKTMSICNQLKNTNE